MTAPQARTGRVAAGERRFNLCRRVHGDEWVEHGSGVTTVTHHSFAAPTHFIILPETPK